MILNMLTHTTRQSFQAVLGAAALVGDGIDGAFRRAEQRGMQLEQDVRERLSQLSRRVWEGIAGGRRLETGAVGAGRAIIHRGDPLPEILGIPTRHDLFLLGLRITDLARAIDALAREGLVSPAPAATPADNGASAAALPAVQLSPPSPPRPVELAAQDVVPQPAAAPQAEPHAPQPAAAAARQVVPPVHDPEALPAILQFLGDWSEQQLGALVAGGKLIIEYAPERLPNYRGSADNVDGWDIEVSVRFHPGGQELTESILDRTVVLAGAGAAAPVSRPVTFDIPADATEAELWFRNFDTAGSEDAWDSQFGENYWYPVTKP